VGDGTEEGTADEGAADETEADEAAASGTAAGGLSSVADLITSVAATTATTAPALHPSTFFLIGAHASGLRAERWKHH
jgi:hypothetical protein